MPTDPKPTTHHMTARTGFRFRAGFQWQTGDGGDPEIFNDVDLSGYEAVLMVKDDPEAAEALITFRSNAPGPTEGQIELDVDGSIDMTATAAQTALWPIGKHYYDLMLEPPDDEPLALLKGNFVVEEGVTR